MKRFSVVLLVFALAFALLVSGCAPQAAPTPAPAPAPAPAPETIELTYIDWNPETSATSQFIKTNLDGVYEKTNGRVRITSHFGGTLVAREDSIPALEAGEVDLSLWTSSHSAGIFHAGLILNLLNAEPAPEYPAMTQAMREMLVEIPEIQQEMQARNMQWLTIRALPGNQLHGAERLILNPDDLRGMNIAALGQLNTMVNEFGGSAVAQAPGDMYQSLTTGLVEGCFMHLAAFIPFKLNEVTKYHTIFPGGGGIDSVAFGILANTNSWARLSAEDQTIVQEAMQTAMDQSIEKHLVDIGNLVEKMKAEGHTFHYLTVEEHAPWAALAQPFIQKWIDEATAAGFNAAAMYEKYVEIVERHR